MPDRSLKERLLSYFVAIAISAGVAWGVASWTVASTSDSDDAEPIPPVALAERPTVSLSESGIVPIVSLGGVVVVGEDGGHYLEAHPTTDELAYRLLEAPIAVKALIQGGPSGFVCTWQGLSQSESGAAALGAGDIAAAVTGVVGRCRIPDDILVVGGLNGMMVLQMGPVTNAQALPVSAVIGGAENGQVVVVREDGTTEVRTVLLGANDTYNIQVLEGLESNERVLVNPTQYDLTHAGLTA